MPAGVFCIVTQGDIAPGRHKEEVLAQIQTLGTFAPETLKKIFSGQPFVLKNHLDRETAEKYQVAIARTGLVTDIQPMATGTPQLRPRQQQDPHRTCPKCGHPQTQTLQCDACGIVFEKYRLQQQRKRESERLGTPLGAKPSPPTKSGGGGSGLLPFLLLLMLVVAGGYFGYHHFRDTGRKEILLFTSNGCAPCVDARNYLTANSVTYSECNIDASEENRKRFDKYGINTLPLAFIGGERIVGYYPNAYAIAVTGLRDRLNGTLSQDIIMYTAPGCGYCNKAREFFEKHNIAYTEYDITVGDNRAQYQNYGPVGTPLIFIGGMRLDGYSEDAMKMALRQVDLL